MRAWTLLVPVKDLGRAKSRLLPPDGTSRDALALALAADTLRAAGALSDVDVVLVSDDLAAVSALADHADRVVSDAPVGLNAALRHAAARCPAGPIAALTADLPALRGDTLREALEAAGRAAYAMVPDAAGTGTTLLAAADPAAFHPRFGQESRRAHERDGARVLDAGPDLRRDVDTAEDLEAARRLGVGPATSALLAVAAGIPG